MDLGSYVAERRKALGLVQQSIADELHYSVQAISRFEQGQSQLSLGVLPALADLPQESFDDLLTCNPTPGSFSGKNKPIDGEAFSKNLVRLRKEKHISQKELALKLGIGERSEQNYEKGNSMPPADVALAMAEFFAVEPSEFFCKSVSDTLLAKAKKKWHPWLLSLLLVIVVGGGVGVAYGLGAFARYGSQGASTDSGVPSQGNSQISAPATSGDGSGSTSASSSSSGSSSSSH
jgi:transcriptional regulator with XRE-family HTH domain